MARDVEGGQFREHGRKGVSRWSAGFYLNGRNEGRSRKDIVEADLRKQEVYVDATSGTVRICRGPGGR